MGRSPDSVKDYIEFKDYLNYYRDIVFWEVYSWCKRFNQFTGSDLSVWRYVKDRNTSNVDTLDTVMFTAFKQANITTYTETDYRIIVSAMGKAFSSSNDHRRKVFGIDLSDNTSIMNDIISTLKTLDESDYLPFLDECLIGNPNEIYCKCDATITEILNCNEKGITYNQAYDLYNTSDIKDIVHYNRFINACENYTLALKLHELGI